MKVCVVYNYPVFGGEHDDYALRFVLTYADFPPGIDHNTIVVSNGGIPTQKMKNIIECMGCLNNVQWLERQNTAKDIGAYVDVSKTSSSDLLVCFGGSIFFWRSGWLKRIVESYQKHGNTVYGTMANSGDMKIRVFPHVRTTGFWISPALLNRYPMKVSNDSDRYEFEHGKNCLTMWAVNHKLKPKLVTWDGEYDIKDWKDAPGSFHRNKQEGLLFKDRLAEPPFYS